jgi:hypothetical protein
MYVEVDRTWRHQRSLRLALPAYALSNQAELNARGDTGGPSAQGLRSMSPTRRLKSVRKMTNSSNNIHTEKNLANPFTKGLPRNVINVASKEMGLRPT